MRKLGLVLSVAVLAAGTVAHAQSAGGISNIVGNASTTVGLPGKDDAHFGPGPGTINGDFSPSGSSFNSFVNVGDTSITFESGNAGALSQSSSTSSVSFRVTNNLDKPVTFNSTITAAGLGFYVADISSGCIYTGCPQVTNHSLGEFNGQTEVGFNFSVTSTHLNADGNPISDPITLYTLSGSMLFNSDGFQDSLGNFGDGPSSPATGARSLTNFGDATGNNFTGNLNTASGITFVWDATDISFDIGSIQNQTLTYSTTVFSNTNGNCLDSDPAICLIAYSAFGDPVGRGGGVENLMAGGDAKSLSSFAKVGGLGINGDNGLINGIHFGQTTFDIPTFNGDGTVTFGSGGVPEPSTWMSLIAGFGLLGAALRRRRVLAYN
jgi:hypothetical protein